MAITDKLSLVIDADGKGAIRELNAVGAAADKELGRAETRAEAMGKTFTKTGVIMVGAAAVMGVGLFKAAQAASDAELQVVKLENALKNNPKTAGVSTKSFEELATAIQGKTAADADQIVSAQAMLATFRLTGDQIKEATPLVVDYARRFGVDLTSAATQVGKAFAGNAATLQRNGVIVDENAYKTDRYGAVISALRENAGGFAEAEGKTFNGSLERMKNQLGDVVEGIGAGVIPVFEAMIGPVSQAAESFSELPDGAQKAVGGVLGFGTAALGAAGAAAITVGKVIELRQRFNELSESQQNYVKAGAKFAGLSVAVLAIAAVGDALIEQYGPADDAAEALQRVANGYTKTELAAGAAGADIKSAAEDLEAAAVTGNSFFEIFSIGSRNVETQLDKQADSQKFLKQAVEEGAASNIEATQAAVDNLERQGVATEELREIIKDATETEVQNRISKQQTAAAINEKVQAELAATQGTEEYAAAQEEAARATDELINATLASLNSGLAYERQLDGLEDSTAEYAQAARDAAAAGGTNTVANEALSDASLALRSDLLGAAAAAAKQAEDQAKATGQTWTAADAARVQRQTLEELKLKYPELTPVIQGYIDKLASIPGETRTTAVFDFRKASADLNAHRQQLQDAANTLWNPGAYPTRRSSGGPISMSGSLVGERGPELFIPNGSGRIISNDRLGNYQRNSGNTISVQVNASGGVNPRAVADEILWKMKVA